MAINDRNFVDNDPSPENRCGADFLNAVKDELNNVIRRAGWDLDFDDSAQVASAIYEMINTTAKASTSTQFLRGTIAGLTNHDIGGNGGLYIDDTNQIFIIYPAPPKSGNISDIQLTGETGTVKIGGRQHSLQQYFAGKEQADRAEKAIAEAGKIYGDFSAIEEAKNAAETAKGDAEKAKEAAENLYGDLAAIEAAKNAAQSAKTKSLQAQGATESARDQAEECASSASEDATATAADRKQTNQDAAATAADRKQTGLDAAATAADRKQTGLDAAATAADRKQTSQDAAAAVTAKEAAENLYGDLAAVEAAKNDAEAARDAIDGYLINNSAGLIGTQAVIMREFNIIKGVS